MLSLYVKCALNGLMMVSVQMKKNVIRIDSTQRFVKVISIKMTETTRTYMQYDKNILCYIYDENGYILRL